MVEPVARIRPFQPSDDKLVRFCIGKANMEPLAVANFRASIHPLTLAVWIGLSCALIEYMHWRPTTTEGWSGYLAPVPIFAAMIVPLIAAIDWFNRPYFEDHTQQVLRRPDVVHLQSHYSLSPASGFWLLEYGDIIIGIIAIDAAKSEPAPSSDVKGFVPAQKTKGTGTVATIRHFYVDEPYRVVGMQNDLLNHAVRHTFEANKTVQSIRAADSQLVPYIRDSLRSSGFKLQEYTEKVGVFRWKLGLRLLEREDWQKAGNHSS